MVVALLGAVWWWSGPAQEGGPVGVLRGGGPDRRGVLAAEPVPAPTTVVWQWVPSTDVGPPPLVHVYARSGDVLLADTSTGQLLVDARTGTPLGWLPGVLPPPRTTRPLDRLLVADGAHLVAVDPRDGTLRSRAGFTASDLLGPGVAGAVAVPAGPVVLASTARGTTIAVDPAGRRRWQTTLWSPVAAPDAAVLVGERDRLAPAGVRAVGLDDGRTRWELDEVVLEAVGSRTAVVRDPAAGVLEGRALTDGSRRWTLTVAGLLEVGWRPGSDPLVLSLSDDPGRWQVARLDADGGDLRPVGTVPSGTDDVVATTAGLVYLDDDDARGRTRLGVVGRWQRDVERPVIPLLWAAGDTAVLPSAGRLVAIDLTTGQQRWRTPPLRLDPPAPLVVADDGLVVAATPAGAVALDAAVGLERWRWPGRISDLYGTTDGVVAVDGVITALDLDGQPRWRVGPQSLLSGWSTPVGDVLVVDRTSTRPPTGMGLRPPTEVELVGVDLSAGAVGPPLARVPAPLVAPPASDGRALYVLTPGELSAVTAAQGVTWRTEAVGSWVSTHRGTVLVAGLLEVDRYDASTGQPTGGASTGGLVALPPVVAADGAVVAVDGWGRLRSVDAGGAVRWAVDLEGPPAGALAVAGDGVLIGTGGGVELRDLRDGAVRWRTDLPAPASGPAVWVDGTLVLRLADGTIVGLR